MMKLHYLLFALIITFPTIVIAGTSQIGEEYYAESSYPSASQCANCHQQIYNEWASSNHAYASISPMFHKFEQAVNELTSGTMGTFCVRCHQQVGTQKGEARHLPLWDRSRVAREGITCITCHRIDEEYGKVNGERTVTPGNIHAPVGGTMRGSVFNDVLERKSELKLATTEKERGSKIHAGVYKFEQLGKSEFCVSCHQVKVNLGIKLEVVWDQYRDSPAFEKGETCQDCHMGKVPGVAAGYDTGPSAIVNGEAINPNRRHSNHAFYGPGYPIAHPGIFPHNPDAERWTIQEWLKFNYRAKWGSPDFESSIEDYSEYFDNLDGALEGLGGNVAALDALEYLDAAVARGASAFKEKTSIDQLTTAIEALETAVDADAIEEKLEELDQAIVELEGFVSESKFATAPKSITRLKKALKAIASEAKSKASNFTATYENLKNRFEVINKSKTEKTRQKHVKKLGVIVAKIRMTMPAAANEFTAEVLGLKASMGVKFASAWIDPGDREEAWEIIQTNLGRLEDKREGRRQVMENGSRIDGPFFAEQPTVGNALSFKYKVTNTDDGHNLPSGSLGAQPEIWMNVALTDPDGKNVWESGYVDKNGDFADNHSLEVAAGKIAYDDQIFNLQTKFLTTNVKGTDREMYLPVNFDIDQRPLLRESNVPTTVLNHPPFVRMEGRSIPPLGHRYAEYKVPAELLTQPGKYKLSVRMRSRAEPIYFMRFVGATPEMEKSMNEWMLDIHPYSVEFEVR
jgi:nitrate/TMAO reductase-like tetraheme cytochrome c subunit